MPDHDSLLGGAHYARLTPAQCAQLHHASLTILERTGERRKPVLQNMRDGITMCDVLENVDFVMSLFLPSAETAVSRREEFACAVDSSYVGRHHRPGDDGGQCGTEQRGRAGGHCPVATSANLARIDRFSIRRILAHIIARAGIPI